MAFTERTSAPAVNNKYYVRTTYGGLNKCILIDSTTGSVLPNCTGYAYGRFMECVGIKSCNLPTSDAGQWYRSAIYEKGKTPRLGAVACWEGGQQGLGHVAIVERIDPDGTVTVSESGYFSKVRFQRRSMKAPFNFNSLTFQGFIYNPKVESKSSGKMILPEGKFETEYNNQRIIGYGQRSGQKLGMISADGPKPLQALQHINEIDSKQVIIFASMNCNYFQMATNQADPYGTHYGTEISLTNHFSPHQGNVLAYGVKYDGQSVGCQDNEFWYTAADVSFACAPAHIAYLRGQKVGLWSSAFRNTKANPGTQSMLIRTTDRFALAVCSGSLTVQECVTWAEECIDGLMDLCFFDSGGSTQIMIGNEIPVYTGREIPNVLSFYVLKSDYTEPDPVIDPEPSDEDPRDEKIKELTRKVADLETKLERIKAILEGE